MLLYGVRSKEEHKDLTRCILVKQIDILADIKRFLIESSTNPTYNDYQKGLNPIREQFESNMDDNNEMNISH